MKNRYYFFLLFCTLILFSCKPEEKRTAQTEECSLGKAYVSFRIGLGQSLPEERYEKLLNLFDKYPGVTDEITFFTSTTHAVIPLETFTARMEVLKSRMQKAREHGYKTGINILNTIGHHDENMANVLKGAYTRLTDIDGRTCEGCFCPNDSRFMDEYVHKIYESMVEANPDYIWIDDDVRFGHKSIGYACFCDNCMDIFNKEFNTDYSRAELKKAFSEGKIDDKLVIRNLWLQHNRNTVNNLFAHIEHLVHTLNPGIKLGFMTGDRFFEGYDFDNWAQTLSGNNRTEVLWRPGGGFYTDEVNSGLAMKAHDIGRQVSVLPADMRCIESEIECFPYQRLKKGANIIALEAASYIASGCTGVAYNVLSFNNEDLDEYEPLLELLSKRRPFFDLMVQHLGRTPIKGIQTFWDKNSAVNGNIESGYWNGWPGLVSHELYNIGLPASYSNTNADVFILGKNNIYNLSSREIIGLLSKGVYMDAEALNLLNEKGYGEYTGFKVAGSRTDDCIERLTDHPLNGKFAGRERDTRQSFWDNPAYFFEKTDPQAEILSSVIDYTYLNDLHNRYSPQNIADCTMGIFENKLGGRICVAGYSPWSFNETLSKSSQLKTVFQWLSHDRLPGYIESYHKINLWIRETQEGNTTLAFVNSSFDAAENVVLALNTDKNKIKVVNMDCEEQVIPARKEEGKYKQFIIPTVDPWQILLICTE